jgi:hypothetical protein
MKLDPLIQTKVLQVDIVDISEQVFRENLTNDVFGVAVRNAKLPMHIKSTAEWHSFHVTNVGMVGLTCTA